MKLTGYNILLFVLSIFLLSPACETTPKEPTLTEGRAILTRGFTNPALNQSDTLVLRSNEPRVVRKENIAVLVSDLTVTSRQLSGGGLLPYEAYVSATFFRNNNLFNNYTNAGGGNLEWLASHLDRLAIVTKANYIQHANDYEYEPGDSTLNITALDNPNSELHPVYDASGASYLAHLDRTDIFIPWSHPDVDPDNIDANCFLNAPPDVQCIDMQALTRMLYGSFTGAVSASVAGMSLPAGATAALGGPNNDGAFKLRFVPQTQYKTGTSDNDRIVGKGVAFIFEGTIRINAPILPVGIAELKLYLPVFLFMNRISNDLLFTTELQPFRDIAAGITPAYGTDKIVVLTQTAMGILSNTVADSARTSILRGLANLPNTDTLFAATMLTANAGLEFGFNRYIDKQRKVGNRLNYQVIALPTQCVNRPTQPLCFEYNGIIDTQVQPEDGNHTPIHLFVLEL